MHIKRFQAQDINKTLEKVKEEFGDDAIILKTNRIKKRDPYSNNSESFIEIIAAIDYENLNSDNKKNTSVHKKSSNKSPDFGNDIKDQTNNLINSSRQFIDPKLSQTDISSSPVKSPLLLLYQIFSEIGIMPHQQQELTLNFLSDKNFSNNFDYNCVLSWLIKIVKKRINFAPNIEDFTNPLWVAVIGPTGSGKTLTTAKLAADLKFNQKKNGILISMDNYKLGAIEHLKRYAAIMDIPFYTAKNPENLREIILNNKDKDYILIDTFGKTISDSIYYNELSDIFNTFNGSIRGLALLPAPYRIEILKKYIKYYSNFPVYGWVLTKIDEIDSFLPVFSLLNDEKLPLAYITNGQKIPENLLNANSINIDKIMEKFCPKNNNKEEFIFQENHIKHEKSKLEFLREIQA